MRENDSKLFLVEINVRLFDNESKKLLDAVTYPFVVGQSLDSLFEKSIFFNHRREKIDGTFVLSEISVLNFIHIKPLTVFGRMQYISRRLIHSYFY